jgi:glycosyltransferase involved in cell wall biosynthesis
MNLKRSVSLVYWASGSGIEKDIRILDRALSDSGYSVNHIVTRNRKSKPERIFRFLWQLPRLVFKRNIQVHVEQIHREQFRFGKINILMPNPEFTDSALFNKIDERPIVFCKSRRAENLFNQQGLKSLYTGFTSEDNFKPDYKKDFRRFIHVAGASNFKGTDVVADVWRRHPDWPTLTIIRTLKDCYGNPRKSFKGSGNLEVIERWLPEDQLAELQNTSGIHLCPSEMEGFGHYIVEALSVGSIVVTTDAPPMSELVDESCGFRVKAILKGNSYMKDRWSVDPQAFADCIEKILLMPETELRQMGKLARLRYEQLNNCFPVNLKNAMNEL